ncbi:MAG: hypothetical protein AAGF46_09805, partial [Pseudomonadota bacterium]
MDMPKLLPLPGRTWLCSLLLACSLAPVDTYARIGTARVTVVVPDAAGSRTEDVEPRSNAEAVYETVLDLALNATPGAAGQVLAVAAISDPSICYQIQATNPEPFPSRVFMAFNLPVTLVTSANTVSATLRVDLQDTNGDGSASMTVIGGADRLQRGIYISDDTSQPAVLLPADLGANLTAAGVYNYSAPTSPGPTATTQDILAMILSFDLSPGDTFNAQGSLFVDIGTGMPVCSIPSIATSSGSPGALPPPNQ